MRYRKLNLITIVLLAIVLVACVSCGEKEETGFYEPPPAESTETGQSSEKATEPDSDYSSGTKSMQEQIDELAEKYKDDPEKFDQAVYALYEGVSVDEAVRRFELMNDAGPLQAEIVENEESYAGSWIQHQPEYKIVFAFKGNGEEIIKKYVEEGSPLAESIKILTFKYSYKELEEIRDSIKSAMESKDVYSYIEIDMQSNSIDFRFYDKESADKVIRQEGLEIPDCVNILQYEGLEIPGSLLTEEDRALDRSNKDELNWSQWWAISVNGSAVLRDALVTMFLKYDGIVTGTSGCNLYWCYYNQKGPYIRISGAGMTAMGCADEILAQEDTFLACLRNASSFVIESDTLTLFDASVGVLVVFERRPEYPMNPEDLIGTSWRLYSVDGEPIGENEIGTIIFDEDGVSLHAEDMINTYEYIYEARGDDIVFTSGKGERIRDSSGNLAHGRPSAISYFSNIISYRLIDGRLEIYTERQMNLVFVPVGITD